MLTKGSLLVLFLLFRLSVALGLFRNMLSLLRDEQEGDKLTNSLKKAFHNQ